MEKFGMVFRRLSMRTANLATGPSDDDEEESILPDTKREVFELFSKTTTRQHRPSAISSCSSGGEAPEEQHRSGSGSLKPVASTRPYVRNARHHSVSPHHHLEVYPSTSPPSGFSSTTASGSSMMRCTPPLVVRKNSYRTLTVDSAANPQAIPPYSRSPNPSKKTPHRATFAPITISVDGNQTTSTAVASISESASNRHCQEAHGKTIQKDAPQCTPAASASALKEQGKRRSSVFVKRGSVSMEPIKRVALDDVYEVYKQLGTGRFGCIKLALHKESKCKIAIKLFPRPKTKQVNFIREYNYSFFLSPHPNIIDTYEGMYQADDETAFFFVQEICPCASLREAVEASQNGIGENATRSVMSQLLAALEYMHSENLVHRNLKAENVLIFDSKDFSKVKLTDFGLTRKVGSAVKYLEYVNNYHAPELCETVVNEVLTVGRSIDIWAVGIIFYYCIKGRFPWQKATIMCKPYWEWEQWLKRKSPLLPKRFDPFSEKSLKVLKKTLNLRYKDRWSAKDVRKCILKEKLLKPQKSTNDEYNYYPRMEPHVDEEELPRTPSRKQPKQKRKSGFHKWLSSTFSTMSQISEQVVSARDQ